ncbi:MAG: ATP-binding protein [Bdellovibrionales bacterium]
MENKPNFKFRPELFFQSAFDLISVSNMDGYFIELNNAWSSETGYSIDILKSTPFMNFVVKSDHIQTQKVFEELLNGKSIVNFKNRYIKKNGDIMWLEWSAWVQEDLIYSIARNNSEAVEKTLLLEKTEEVGQIGTWEVDTTTGKASWSDYTFKIHGLPVGGEIPVEDALNFYSPEARPIIEEALNRAMAEGKAWDLELPFVRATGEKIWVRAKGEPQIQNGKIMKITGVFQDISDRKETEKKLQEQQVKILQNSRLSSLGEMAAGIAHEINNPLSVINGYADRMIGIIEKEKEELSAESLAKVLKAADRISTTSERIATIIRGLRDFSRDGSKDKSSICTIDDLINDTLDFCRQKFVNRNVDLRVSAESREIFVQCKRVQLSQVLLNLLNNAFDAITDLDQKEPWIVVNATVENDKVKIAVTDSGEGIDKKVAAKIMQPFFTSKEIGKGTGLGLSISKGIIESHSGKIWLDHSSVNTKFVVELPYNSQSVLKRKHDQEKAKEAA